MTSRDVANAAVLRELERVTVVRFPRVIADASRARRRIARIDSTADETFSTRRSLARRGERDDQDARALRASIHRRGATMVLRGDGIRLVREV